MPSSANHVLIPSLYLTHRYEIDINLFISLFIDFSTQRGIISKPFVEINPNLHREQVLGTVTVFYGNFYLLTMNSTTQHNTQRMHVEDVHQYKAITS